MKLLFTIVAVVALASIASAATYSTSATGRLLCLVGRTFHPIKEATVKLLDKNILKDELIGETTSDSNGFFVAPGMSTSYFSKPDPYIKVMYQYSGIYGEMKVNGLLRTLRSDSTAKQLYQEMLDLGDIIFSSDHCRAYVQFYNALQDYYNRTGEAFLIRPLRIRTKAIISFGRPYSQIKTVNIPKSYPVTLKTAKRQLGHIIRHSLDGSLAHLLKDAIRFRYRSPHTCASATNQGFAFDEGFARFWAGECTDLVYYGFSPSDYNIEGNVAIALRRLQVQCAFTDSDMIDVLRRNRGQIHSFDEYEQASGCSNLPFQPTTEGQEMMTTERPVPGFGITGFEEEAREQKERELVAALEELLERE